MNAQISARVLLGGRLQGYMGRLPGLAEEAIFAIRAAKPLYLAGGFQGCTGALIAALLGETPDALTEAYQFRDAAYRQMLERHNTLLEVEAINYPTLIRELAAYGMDGLCAGNGLTEAENRRLFETPHLIEMVYLVLRGLLRLFGAAA
jgi:hypothetical protein